MVDFHRALDKAMQNALALRAEGDVAGAVSEIGRVLADARVPAEVRSEAIAFRGTLWEDTGRFLDAKQDYLEAHRLTDEANYRRYTLELSLGKICENLSDLHGSAGWYREALKTAAGGRDIIAASAIEALLGVEGEGNLSPDDRSLCESALQLSWSALRLDGSPDTRDLSGMARRVIRAAGRAEP